MSTTAINVDCVSKRFAIGQRSAYPRFSELPAQAISLMGNWLKNRRSAKDARSLRADNGFWALKDISFELKHGGVLGIIGRNGAGKSTLLKILSRISRPTSGEIRLRGRVGSLLEVGSGFHPELTGRENIFLNGAILGMRRREIRRKFDEIVAFSEVERFLDTSVKHYSSGMYTRLAFAVAAHLEPEILIVDEVLAVGDAQFQKKCLGKMGQVANEGRTVLFVSHNMAAISTLCGRAILLSQGRMIADGTPADVIEKYLQTTGAGRGECVWNDPETAPGTGIARLLAVRVAAGGRITADVGIDQEIEIHVEYQCLVSGAQLTVSLHLFHHTGVCVLSTGPASVPHAPGKHSRTCVIPPEFLNDGAYTIRALIVGNTSHIHAQVDDAVTFIVHDSQPRTDYLGQIIGVVRPRLEWTCNRAAPPAPIGPAGIADRQ